MLKCRTKKLDESYWKYQIAFYLDVVGFHYKTNPPDQAREPKACEWHKKGEGLDHGRTAKGKKEGAVNYNFMVGISYNCGVILCEQWFGAMTGAKMADIVDNSFEQAFQKSGDSKRRLFLMDGCLCQNSKTALKAIKKHKAQIFKIPACSPDLNPTENVFQLVSKSLARQAIQKNITCETFAQFSARIKKTMEEFSVETINNIIGSMNKCIDMVLKAEVNRIRYWFVSKSLSSLYL